MPSAARNTRRRALITNGSSSFSALIRRFWLVVAIAAASLSAISCTERTEGLPTAPKSAITQQSDPTGERTLLWIRRMDPFVHPVADGFDLDRERFVDSVGDSFPAVAAFIRDGVAPKSMDAEIVAQLVECMKIAPMRGVRSNTTEAISGRSATPAGIYRVNAWWGRSALFTDNDARYLLYKVEAGAATAIFASILFASPAVAAAVAYFCAMNLAKLFYLYDVYHGFFVGYTWWGTYMISKP